MNDGARMVGGWFVCGIKKSDDSVQVVGHYYVQVEFYFGEVWRKVCPARLDDSAYFVEF